MTERTGAIIVAAGRSERMAGIDKLFEPVGGAPLLLHSVRAFAGSPLIDAVVVVVSEASRARVESLMGGLPALRVVNGGARRRDSVRAGIEALPDCDYVLVHDGARPFVTADLIESTLVAARGAGAALCAVPVTDTVKREGPGGIVAETVSRDGLWLAQTPQAFRRDLLLRAHAATNVDATDDAALVEALGEPVRLVPGSARNIKVTTPVDLALARLLAAEA
jgi:2-C-methyl-D-erythritol 4-phosphate cytidylyltransferase